MTADREVRIVRLMNSRGYSREKALSIMENQCSDTEFRAHGDVVIDNSETPEETGKQVRTAMYRLMKETESDEEESYPGNSI